MPCSELISAYRYRIRGLPKYELRERGKEFHAKLEKRRTKNCYHIKIGKSKPQSPVGMSVQEQLLDQTLTGQQKCMLDADLTQKELQETLHQLKDEKTQAYTVSLPNFI